MLKIKQGDIRQLLTLFSGGFFDTVVSLGLIEHFHYPIDMIRRMLEVVRIGGVLILEMPNFRNWFYYAHNHQIKKILPFHLWWGVQEWRKILVRCRGCRLEEIQTVDFIAYDLLARVIAKISARIADIEIIAENTLLNKGGSLAFYKLRKV